MAEARVCLYALRSRQSLLDLSRRLQSNPDEEVVDFIIFRWEQVCVVVRLETGLTQPLMLSQKLFNCYKI